MVEALRYEVEGCGFDKYTRNWGHAVTQFVEALCYEVEGCGFEKYRRNWGHAVTVD